MDDEAIAAELRDRARRVPAPPLDRPWLRRLVRLLVRAMPSVRTPGVAIEARRAGGRSGGRALRLYRPATRRTDAALLWIHGGGYMIGAPRQDDRLCGGTCAALGITIVSAGYRLAPEHGFPAAADDVRAAWGWLLEHARELGVDPARIVVGGQSAGGGLAAGLVQRLHDEGGARPIAQWLFAPMIDDRTAADPAHDAAGHRVWTNALNRIAWRALTGRAPGAAELPAYAAPARRASLAGLPRAWIGVGAIDLFHDEDRRYAQRLREAGIEVELDVVPGAPHGFEAWAHDTAVARDYVARARAWLGRVVAMTD